MCGAGCCAVSAAVAMRMRAGPVGKRHDLLVDDDLLDLLQALLIERQNGVAHELLLLQFADDVAIVD